MTDIAFSVGRNSIDASVPFDLKRETDPVFEIQSEGRNPIKCIKSRNRVILCYICLLHFQNAICIRRS